MGFLSKYKKEILIGAVLTLSYFILRLIFLSRLPIFTDEAIYIRWAQIALNDASWRFISLTDGKQPMFIWAAAIFIKFIKDPLIASRLVSVFSGFITMVGIYFLTNELFKKKEIAFFASFLYIWYPFAQVYDRMALMDGMVGTLYVWALYFSILLVRKVRLDIAYTLAFVIGAGVLTKTTNFFSIYLLPFTLVLFDFKKSLLKKRLFDWVVLAVFTVIISYAIYDVLRLSPLFEMIEQKNALFVYPFSQWIHHPFTYLVGNLSGLSSWLIGYLKLPYIILILISLVIYKKFWKEKLLLVLYFLLPFVALAVFGRIIFPRFIYFMSLMLIPLAAYGLDYLLGIVAGLNGSRFYKITVMVIIILIFVSYSAFVSYKFAEDPINSPIATADNSQYVNSWAAGWGVKESVSFFTKQAENQKIFVGTEGTFGLMPESMEIYLIKNKNITIKGYWPVDIIPQEALNYSEKMPAYFIFYQPQHVVIPISFPLKLVFEVRQGNTKYFYRVYQVIPPTK